MLFRSIRNEAREAINGSKNSVDVVEDRLKELKGVRKKGTEEYGIACMKRSSNPRNYSRDPLLPTMTAGCGWRWKQSLGVVQ